jgi:hypothetical protein
MQWCLMACHESDLPLLFPHSDPECLMSVIGKLPQET